MLAETDARNAARAGGTSRAAKGSADSVGAAAGKAAAGQTNAGAMIS